MIKVLLCTGVKIIKYLPAIIIAVACFALRAAAPSFAMDREGCLTCHQYPGLVSMEKPDRYTVLHIDEDKYLRSPHGRVECIKCHRGIKKIPHTGEKEVNCTVECHQEDKEKIYAVDLELNPIHRDEKFSITNLQCRSSCMVCHPLYPHSEHNIVRAYINMHSGFVICEVCHLRIERASSKGVCDACHSLKAALTYEWTEPERVEFKGRPYGRYYRLNRDWGFDDFFSGLKKIFSPRKEAPVQKKEEEYSISRIAIVSVAKGGRKRSLMNVRDTEAAIDFRAREETMDPEEKRMKSRYFHRDIARHKISVACDECHSENSILDYKKLGFGEIKANKLRRLNIKGLVTKYETFYFPKLLKPVNP